jgi:hypothetical protein
MIEPNPLVQLNNAREDERQAMESRRVRKCTCSGHLGDPNCPIHGYLKSSGFASKSRPVFDGPAVIPVAPVLKLTATLTASHTALKKACFEMLDNIKRRYPRENRTKWFCPDMQKISDLIEFH